MLIPIIAEAAQAASTLDKETVLALLGYLLGTGAIGGGCLALGKKMSVRVANRPLYVAEDKELATKEDLIRMIDEVKDELQKYEDRLTRVEGVQRTDINAVYGRLNIQGETLSEVLGLLKGLSEKFNIQPARTRP